jgi:hypothetical protein
MCNSLAEIVECTPYLDNPFITANAACELFAAATPDHDEVWIFSGALRYDPRNLS